MPAVYRKDLRWRYARPATTAPSGPSFLTIHEYRLRLQEVVYARWSEPEAREFWERAYKTWVRHTREGKDPEEAYALTLPTLGQPPETSKIADWEVTHGHRIDPSDIHDEWSEQHQIRVRFADGSPTVYISQWDLDSLGGAKYPPVGVTFHRFTRAPQGDDR